MMNDPGLPKDLKTKKPLITSSLALAGSVVEPVVLAPVVIVPAPVQAHVPTPATIPPPIPVAIAEPIKRKLRIKNNLMQILHLSLFDKTGRMRSLEILAKEIREWDDVDDLGPEASRLENRRHITILRNA